MEYNFVVTTLSTPRCNVACLATSPTCSGCCPSAVGSFRHLCHLGILFSFQLCSLSELHRPCFVEEVSHHHLSPPFQFPSERSYQSSCFWLSGLSLPLSMMMFSSGTRSSLRDIVVPRNLQFNKLSCISFLTASIFPSSLIVPNLFSSLFMSFTNVLRMSSSCQSCSSDRVSSRSRAALRNPSVLLSVALLAAGFVCCRFPQYLAK